jgi:hypothetical protein
MIVARDFVVQAKALLVECRLQHHSRRFALKPGLSLKRGMSQMKSAMVIMLAELYNLHYNILGSLAEQIVTHYQITKKIDPRFESFFLLGDDALAAAMAFLQFDHEKGVAADTLGSRHVDCHITLITAGDKLFCEITTEHLAYFDVFLEHGPMVAIARDGVPDGVTEAQWAKAERRRLALPVGTDSCRVSPGDEERFVTILNTALPIEARAVRWVLYQWRLKLAGADAKAHGIHDPYGVRERVSAHTKQAEVFPDAESRDRFADDVVRAAKKLTPLTVLDLVRPLV